MLSKEEIEKLEELTNRCENCGNKQELGFCVDCYIEQSEMSIMKKLFIDYKQLESNNKKLIEKLEKILREYEHVLASEESAINLYSKIKNIVKGEKE